MHFAKRMDGIQSSGIRAIFDRARQVPDALDLSIGQVDADVPEAVKEATIGAVRGRCGGYSPTAGYPDVVAKVHRHLVTRHELPPGDEVMLTAGTTGGIALAILALADRGDEVLVPDPHFVLYRHAVAIAGATPVFYDLYPGFRLRVEAIVAHVTDRTRLLVLNNPSNPTGASCLPEEIEAVTRACRERGIRVLADELHSPFTYDRPHVPVKRYLGDEAVLVGGPSKSHAMAGWRIGWAAGEPGLIQRMCMLQQYLYTCPPTLVQRGLVAALDVDVGDTIERHRRKRDLVLERLLAAGYELERPEGSIFAFPRVPWGDDVAFCEAALRREKLMLVPGRVFSLRTTHFRLCYSVPDAVLDRALDGLARMVRPD